jgi:hypothetical protein
MAAVEALRTLLLAATLACAPALEGGIIDDGMAVNEHFSLRAWFRPPVDPRSAWDGALLLENVTRVAVGVSFGLFDFPSDPFIAWTIDPQAPQGLWGVAQGKGKVLERMPPERPDGFPGRDTGSHHYRSIQMAAMESRPVIVLLPGEGYGRRFAMPAGYFRDARFASLAAFRLRSTLLLNEHVLEQGAAVRPGQAVALRSGRSACAGGTQDVVLERQAQPQPDLRGRPAGLPLELSVFAVRTSADGDLEVRYLVGNDARGATPETTPEQYARLWLWQNDCGPATARLTVRDGETVIAEVAAEAAAALAALQPARPPVPLLWGEVLSWRLTVPAAALAKARAGRRLTVALAVSLRAGSGEACPVQPPAPMELTCATSCPW